MLKPLPGFMIALTIGWIVAGSVAAQAQTTPKVASLGPDYPKSALFIGNSFFYYNSGIQGHVSLLENAADPEHKQAYRNTAQTIGGAGFDRHDVESYFRVNATGNNNVGLNKPEKLFDAAIMMDCSRCPIHPNMKSVFTEYAKKDADIVRSHGAKPVFFMSWAYADEPEMTAQLAEAYTVAGNDNNALVIPAGLAFAKSLARKPELALHAPDKQHPSLAGTYLASCVVFAALTGKSPVGNSYLAGINATTARFLQEVAWETVQEYYGNSS
jgi:hypothetical protein